MGFARCWKRTAWPRHIKVPRLDCRYARYVSYWSNELPGLCEVNGRDCKYLVCWRLNYVLVVGCTLNGSKEQSWDWALFIRSLDSRLGLMFGLKWVRDVSSLFVDVYYDVGLTEILVRFEEAATCEDFAAYECAMKNATKHLSKLGNKFQHSTRAIHHNCISVIVLIGSPWIRKISLANRATFTV